MRRTESTQSDHQHNILCVDDNELGLFVNASILRSHGYKVFVCSDPFRAVSIATSEQVDLAIFDYEMPGINGAELAALCKAANPHLKVILFSGSLTVPGRDLAFADLFLEKTGPLEVLLDDIESLLAENTKQPVRLEHLHQQ